VLPFLFWGYVSYNAADGLVLQRVCDMREVIDSIDPLPDLWSMMQRTVAKQKLKSNKSITLTTRRSYSRLVQDRLRFSRSEWNAGSPESGRGKKVISTPIDSPNDSNRRFFSSILQRASKASEALGSGSVTVVPAIRVYPASDNPYRSIKAKLKAIENDPKLSDSVEAKLRHKLR